MERNGRSSWPAAIGLLNLLLMVLYSGWAARQMNSPSGDQWSLSCSYIPLGLASRTRLLPPPPAIWQELKHRQNINDTQKRCRKITPSSRWISLPPEGPLRSGPFLKSLLRSVTFSGLPIHFHILSLCEPQSLFPLLSRQTGCCLPMVSLLPLSFFFASSHLIH